MIECKDGEVIEVINSADGAYLKILFSDGRVLSGRTVRLSNNNARRLGSAMYRYCPDEDKDESSELPLRQDLRNTAVKQTGSP